MTPAADPTTRTAAPSGAPARGGAPAPDGGAPAPGAAPTPGGVAAPGPGAPPVPSPGAVPAPGPTPGVPLGPGMPPGSGDIPAPPVLAPAGPSPGRRARHAPAPRPRVDRAARRGLRVNQRLWSIDPWSVFKISALFYLCIGLIVLVAGTLLYNVGRSVGTIDQFEGFVTRMGAYGSCTPKAKLAKGVEFQEDNDCATGQVLVGGFKLDDGTLFKAAAVGTGILVLAGSIGSVLLTVLINLLNEMTGGLRHTVVREPVARQPGQQRGSPRRRPQG
jgi:Transmembrane domain of unknown function (DUF3566)